MRRTTVIRKIRKSFEDEVEVAAPSFKDALFVFEMAELPEDLKVCPEIVREFKKTAEAQTTCIVTAGSVLDAAEKIDKFKNRHCGSSFTLALINLNQFEDVDEFKFLMQRSVLGNPRTIFVGTMRHMTSAVYTEARNKVLLEDELRFGAPSCIDSYGASNRGDVYGRIGRLAAAYLRDSEERTRVGKTGSVFLQRTSPALEELYKIPTAFYGNRFKRPAK
ncbi:MAG TPA: hypothetical protein VKX17_02310 [Planctomycetota bacterium]|nr:hypothetical protein [Planctomycetota bacterium]